MKSKHLIAIFIVAALAIVVASTLQISSTSENYTKELEASREEKNKMFKNSKESPLTSSQKDHFTSLTYFPIDPDYNIRADFNPISEKSYITIPYSDGSSERYLKFGYAEFVLNEQKQRVLILKPTIVDKNKEDYLFLPFYDNTSTRSTYGGGRYVEPELVDENTLKIDFNTAYNPYCAYNETYRCPLPPKINNIETEVRAGEKKFQLKE